MYYLLNYHFLQHQCLFIPELKGSPPNINQAKNLSTMRDFSPLLTLTHVTNRKTTLLHFTYLIVLYIVTCVTQVKITTRSRRQDCRDLKGKSTVPNPLLRPTRIQRLSCEFIQHGAS